MHQALAVGVFERRQRFGEQALGRRDAEGAVLLHPLREVFSQDQLHHVPLQPRPALNVVDAHDVGMAEPRGQLRFAPEPLDHAEIGGEGGVQDFDRHPPLEGEVARAIHAAEAARAQLLEQLVVVPQRAPQPPLEARVDELRLRRGLVKRARVHHQILQHLRRGEITVAGPGPQRA